MSHLSVVMTTAQVAQTTGDNTATLPSSHGAALYFGCAVIVIGIVGTAANALVLYALVASKQHKKLPLILNQNLLDLTSSLLLAVVYALKISSIYLTGLLGYWLCMLLLSENLIWLAIEGSVINLAVIAVERYLKIVRPIWSRKHMGKSTEYLLSALPWILSFLYNMTVTFQTSAVIDGVCHAFIVWDSRIVQMIYALFYFLAFYPFMLLIFVVCYGRILVAIRRQAAVMAGHVTAGTTVQQTAAQIQENKIQSNVIKTMIVVCAFYAVGWLPENVYYLLTNFETDFTMLQSGYYAVMFIAFLNICANPFIYAAKFDPVKQKLLMLVPCKPGNSVGTAAASGTPAVIATRVA